MRLSAQIAGIDISDDAVRIAVVRTGGRAPRLVEAMQVALVPGADADGAAMAAREALSRLKSKPAATVLCAPASWCVLRLLKVPFRSARKISAAIAFELEPTLAIPIDELVVKHLVARSDGGETEVLAIGARRGSMEKQVAALEAAGIHIDGVYVDALALTALWAGLRKRDAAPHAVLHFRPNDAALGVMESGRLTYMRRVDMDHASFRANPSAAALEIRNLLRAYAAERGGGNPPADLSVTGAPLSQAGRTIFETEFDVPVRFDDFAAAMAGYNEAGPTGGESADEFNQWSAPVSVAYAAAGGPLSVDFMETSSQRGLARLALRTCLAGSAVLAAYLLLVFLDYRKDRATLDGIGEAIYGELQATYPDLITERPADDIGGAKSLEMLDQAAVAESDASQGISLERFSSPALLDVLMELSAALDSKVVEITRISQRPGTKEVTIEGSVVDPGNYDAALDKLDQSQLIDVDRDHSTRTTEGGKDNFVLRVRIA